MSRLNISIDTKYGKITVSGDTPEEIIESLDMLTEDFLDQVNERLSLELPQAGISTIAGYVTQELGHIGTKDEVVDVAAGQFVVVEANARRIEVLIFRPRQETE